jgi:hypothetical protein
VQVGDLILLLLFLLLFRGHLLVRAGGFLRIVNLLLASARVQTRTLIVVCCATPNRRLRYLTFRALIIQHILARLLFLATSIIVSRITRLNGLCATLIHPALRKSALALRGITAHLSEVLHWALLLLGRGGLFLGGSPTHVGRVIEAHVYIV